MRNYVQRHLGAKLLFSYLAVIVMGGMVLFLTSQSLLPSSFDRHMAAMGTGGMMGMGNPGLGGSAAMGQLFLDYRAGFNEALLYAAGAATLVAVLLSVFFSRSVVAPVRAMTAASQRIADGRYQERVQVGGSDELSELAARFNQMAGQLEQVEDMRRRLIGDVSHELRTPLTAIKGSMEGLIDGVLPASPETFQQIHAEAGRLNRLVDDLQELSRVEAHAYALDIRPLDVSSLVRTVFKRLDIHAASRQISLELALPPNLPPVLADEDRSLQVLTNLVGNALQYTPAGGMITVSAQPVHEEIQISIRDTGTGIRPEHLARIFDRFYRVDKSRSRQAGGGSGIGLTIARALVEAQGGRIWAESEGAGKGSTFRFTLPKAT